jgi:peptidyl-prolyl cis-trans isomerase SurA
MRVVLVNFLVYLLVICLGYSQSIDNNVLFTVGDEEVKVEEFVRVYKKNLNLVKDESQKDVDNYLELFVNYKLKLAEAYDLDYHKKPQYIREFNSYKSQLTKNYLTDHEVTDELVKEAYERISHDVKASHILIKIDANVEDTSAVYDQILKYRTLLINEPDFSKVQSQVHNGTTIFAEDLGYFSGFKMIYDFENVAFNTPIGEVSQPFRTQYGYHVVKVFDKRKSRGEITVGHIMINNIQKDVDVVPEARIKEIYGMIEQGQFFEDLAKQFSEDQSSAKNGGKLKPFESGQLTSVTFEDEAFKLESEGDISQPFKSDYGWHIIKLYSKSPVGSFEELKNSLEARVRRDPRSARINKAFISKLRKDYGISDENTKLQYFVHILNESYFNNSWKHPEDLPGDKTLLKIGDLSITYETFAHHLESSQKGNQTTKDFNMIVSQQYQKFVDAKLLTYHEGNLENVNQEYANILAEYRDGLLLFDLMETKIWGTVGQDSVGLKKYYEINKNNFMTEDKVGVHMVSTNSKIAAQKIKTQLQQGRDIKAIAEEYKDDGRDKIIVTSETMSLDDHRLPVNFEPNKGVSHIYEHYNSYHIILVNNFTPQRQKTFDEARGQVINEYQQVVEERWLKELKDKYGVTINENTLEKIKNQLKD